MNLLLPCNTENTKNKYKHIFTMNVTNNQGKYLIIINYTYANYN